ncbi:flagellar hook-associated protein 3 FlgL [Rhizobium sp. RU20A]|uniref:flagellar hook-associated family protein n=1 Tax=Rhizobium sp. RU20A TaxID=1907412 RepID=UPI000956841D|nr:flagellar hook-associated family protein [Rhizobium sp. RU20A]SIQ55413.1 flagellar hook-associated protein 3 FlgL [Rhizobium sp. RU20A]
MKTSFVSTLAGQNAMRTTINRAQEELRKLQGEVTTGKRDDAGVSLGSGTSQVVNLTAEIERLNSLKETNTVVSQRLSASQVALDSMRKAGEKINTVLLSVLGSDDKTNLSIAKTDLVSSFQTFLGAANTRAFNGEYLMAGINTDAQPLKDYEPGSPAKATFDNAKATFMAGRGYTSMDQFTVADMDDFVKNTLEPLYTGNQWTTDWSSASDQNIQSRITANEVVQSSSNANSTGVRMFALASVIGMELLDSGITPQVRASLNVTVQNYAQQSIAGLIREASVLGVSQNRVENANTSLQLQTNLVETHLNDLVDVDPYEASTRMNTLLTQIQTSYTLTSRIQQMSLINFLK